MILFTFENDKNTEIKTEAFTSARDQFTCSDVIPTCPIHKDIFIDIMGRDDPEPSYRTLYFQDFEMIKQTPLLTSISGFV